MKIDDGFVIPNNCFHNQTKHTRNIYGVFAKQKKKKNQLQLRVNFTIKPNKRLSSVCQGLMQVCMNHFCRNWVKIKKV